MMRPRRLLLSLSLLGLCHAKLWNWLLKFRSGSQQILTSNSNNQTTNTTKLMDRFALVSSLLRRKEGDANLVVHPDVDPDTITPQSDLTLPGRHFHIVTTAALPWFTGTAVNPLLRAAHLHRRTRAVNGNATTEQYVALVIPWLELPEDQNELYNRMFETPQEQEEYIRGWLRNEAGMEDVADPDSGLKILFYPARYHTGLRSIFAMGDIMSVMKEENMDVCVLEEPEHCNWYRAPGEGWTKRFNFVVGIVHTNYKEYASSHYSGLWTAPALAMVSSAMVRAYCHKIIKLSDTLQTYAVEKETTSNVHGVRDVFLEEGRRRAQLQYDSPPEEKGRVYFVGKLLWAKGLDIMLELEDYYKQCTGEYFDIDIYGSGPDQRNIMKAFLGRKNMDLTAEEEEADLLLEDVSMSGMARLLKVMDSYEFPSTFAELRRQPIPANFPGRLDHAEVVGHDIFVNPSISEVLCTTTAEALAMGKFVIIPVHPSNTFFLQFPNCLAYRDKFEFVANLRWALTHRPEPLTEELLRQFTWEAATDRLIEASIVTEREAAERERLGLTKLDERIAWLHNEMGKGVTGDMLRKILGAGPASEQVQYLRQQGQYTEGEGLGQKFSRSSFAEAMQRTLDDLSLFIQ